MQISQRPKKQGIDDPDNYRLLYSQLCKLINFSVSRVCPPRSAEALLNDSDEADLAARVCECCQVFVVSGHLLVAAPEDVQGLLRHLLMFLQHEYLPLAATALPAWAMMIQDCERKVAASGACSSFLSAASV